MSRIITPMQYKTVPWKNGQGQTTEMAIDENGTLESFDWRISQASVAQDGPFSSFAGYDRQLILLEGNGMLLEYADGRKDQLSNPLDVAVFSGGEPTHATLTDGAIVDFNVITKSDKYEATVTTYVERTTVLLPADQLCFVYCLDAEAVVMPGELRLAPVHLLVVAAEESQGVKVCGQKMIVVCLKRR